MISIQTENFNIDKIINELRSSNNSIGAIVTFSGYVRDFKSLHDRAADHLYLEHYEGMTHKSLEDIDNFARSKWNLIDTRIIHRIGSIKLSEPIVLIVVASKHRDDAFDACRYIIDFLKIEAPFWKKEVSNNHSSWVEQKDSDLVKIK